jgi:predicted MPP superfamily phosphohydrolase
MRYAGVNRIRNYEISSPDLPSAFEGYRIAFASDFHLKSKFKERQLRGTVKALQMLAPDILLLGGDYQEGCEYVEPLLKSWPVWHLMMEPMQCLGTMIMSVVQN